MMMSMFMRMLSSALLEGIAQTRREDTILKLKVGQRYATGVITELLPQSGQFKVEYSGGKSETISVD
jgi:hypothetical protein